MRCYIEAISSFLNEQSGLLPQIEKWINESGSYSPDVEKILGEWSNNLFGILRKWPEVNRENDGNGVIQVELAPQPVFSKNGLSTGERKIVPEFRLPSGVRVEFKPVSGDGWSMDISNDQGLMEYGGGNRKRVDDVMRLVRALNDHCGHGDDDKWLMAEPVIKRGYEDWLINIAKENGAMRLIGVEEIRQLWEGMPEVLRNRIDIEGLTALFYENDGEPGEESGVELQIVKGGNEGLPTAYRDYRIVVGKRRCRDQVVVPVKVEDGEVLEVVEAVVGDSGVEIELSKSLYERYVRRVSREMEKALWFTRYDLSLDSELRREIGEWVEKVRKLRGADLEVFGMNLLGSFGGVEVEDEVVVEAQKALGVIDELSRFMKKHKEIFEKIGLRWGEEEMKLLSYVADVRDIIGSLSEGGGGGLLRRLLHGGLGGEDRMKTQIIDFGGGMIAPSYKGVLAELGRLGLELVVNVNGKLKIRLVEVRREEEVGVDGLPQGLEQLAGAHIDGPVVVMPDGSMEFVRDKGHLVPELGQMEVFSFETEAREAEQDRSVIGEMLRRLNNDLSDEEVEGMVDDVLGFLKKTVSGDPRFWLKEAERILALRKKEVDGVEEIDITKLAAAFLPFHSGQEEVSVERLSRFCNLMGLDETQVSTWCVLDRLKKVTFRLYALKNGDYLWVALFKWDVANQNNVVGVSYVRGGDLQPLIEKSVQQLVDGFGSDRESIQTRNPNETIGIEDPEKGYTLEQVLRVMKGERA